MTVDVADRGLLATVLELADGPGATATGAEIADALGVPAAYSAFVERRLQHNRGLGLLECDEHGNWRLTAAGLAATCSIPVVDRSA